jgi:hypothetical protein
VNGEHIRNRTLTWSGWRDSNPRSPAPKSGEYDRRVTPHVAWHGAHLRRSWPGVGQRGLVTVAVGSHTGSRRDDARARATSVIKVPKRHA